MATERLQSTIEWRQTGVESLDRSQRSLDKLTSASGIAALGAAFAGATVALQGIMSALQSVAGKVIDITKQVIATTDQFAKYTGTFSVMLGSMTAARDRMEEISKIAQRLPFELNDIVEAGVLLEGLALYDPKRLELISDIAAGMNKSLTDTAKAIAGAYTGQMEALKSYGITSAMIVQKLGHDINRETLEGTREVGRAVEEILASRFAGASVLLAESVTGLRSMISDQMTALKRTIGELGLYDDIKTDLKVILELVTTLNEEGSKWPRVVSEHLRNLVADLELTTILMGKVLVQGEKLVGLGQTLRVLPRGESTGSPGYIAHGLSLLGFLPTEFVELQVRKQGEVIKRHLYELGKLREQGWLTTSELIEATAFIPPPDGSEYEQQQAYIDHLEEVVVTFGRIAEDRRKVAMEIQRIEEAEAERRTKLAADEKKRIEEMIKTDQRAWDFLVSGRKTMEEERTAWVRSQIGGMKIRPGEGPGAVQAAAEWTDYTPQLVTAPGAISDPFRAEMLAVIDSAREMQSEVSAAFAAVAAGGTSAIQGMTDMILSEFDLTEKGYVTLGEVMIQVTVDMVSGWFRAKAIQWAAQAGEFALLAIEAAMIGRWDLAGSLGAGALKYAAMAGMAGAAPVLVARAAYGPPPPRPKIPDRGDREDQPDRARAGRITAGDGGPMTINYNVITTVMGNVVGPQGMDELVQVHIIPRLRQARELGQI